MAPKSFIFVSSFELWGWLVANLSASRRSLLDDYQTFAHPTLAACMSIEISIYCDGSMEFVRTLKALADPLRLRVLAAVSEEELTVGEVQEVVASVQSSVSRNLAILRDAGFVRDRKEGWNA